MLEDNRRDLSENAEELKQLQERVKYNYDRLDTLTEVPLKVNKLVRSLLSKLFSVSYYNTLA